MLLEEKSMFENVKKVCKESFISALLLAILAIVLIMNSATFMSTAIDVVAYIAVFMGVMNLVLFYRMTKESRQLSKNFQNGLLLIMFGIIFFVETDIINKMLSFVIGSYFIFESTNKANLAINLEPYKTPVWLYFFVISLTQILVGFLIVIHPFDNIAIHLFIGISILIYEALTIMGNLLIIFGLREKKE